MPLFSNVGSTFSLAPCHSLFLFPFSFSSALPPSLWLYLLPPPPFSLFLLLLSFLLFPSEVLSKLIKLSHYRVDVLIHIFYLESCKKKKKNFRLKYYEGSQEEKKMVKGMLDIFFLFKFYFIFKLYIIVLVLPNIKMNLPHVYMCSPS